MKARKGTLIDRNGHFYSRVKIEGRGITRALYNPDNTPCTTRKDARKAQALSTREIILLSRKEALQATIRKLADVDSELAAIQKPKLRLCDIWQAYSKSGERPDSGQGCLRNYQTHTKQFIAWVKKNHPKAVYLEGITKDIANDYSRHLANTFSNVTHNKNLSFLKLLFRVLLTDKPNPFDRIRKKPKDTTSHESLTQEQLQQVLAIASGELKTFLLVGIYTALRRQDACLLKDGQNNHV